MKIYNVINKIYGLGNGDFDYEAVYNSGYTAGYGSGFSAAEEICRYYRLRRTELTFEFLEDGSISWIDPYTQDTDNIGVRTIEYSKNGGEWTSITSVRSGSGEPVPTIPVQSGDTVQFRGNNTSYTTVSGNYSFGSGFQVITLCNVYGNIMSLIDKYNYPNMEDLSTADVLTFSRLFTSCHIVSAEDLLLPATTLQESCYDSMFLSCYNLQVPPKLPATELTMSCYYQMFMGCSALTTPPELPATTLARDCYQGMFSGCTSLTTAPELPATTLDLDCYKNMFVGCVSLVKAPVLRAEDTYSSYAGMFSNCSSLSAITCLAIEPTNPSPGGYIVTGGNWVSGVAASGIFVKHPDANWRNGPRGIPNGWTVVDAEL